MIDLSEERTEKMDRVSYGIDGIPENGICPVGAIKYCMALPFSIEANEDSDYLIFRNIFLFERIIASDDTHFSFFIKLYYAMENILLANPI